MDADHMMHESDSKSATEATTQASGAIAPSDEVLANSVITTYLLAQSKIFEQLSKLRQQGWENPEGDKFFARQQAAADSANLDTSERAKKQADFFFQMMQNIGKELHKSTGAFNVAVESKRQPRILDLWKAPGGFLSAAMEYNPGAVVTACSLPVEAGGHQVLLPRHVDIDTRMLDITMLAADVGAVDISEDHPDLANFIPKQFHGLREFDIVLGDGQVLRTHSRAAYREHSEPRRLAVTQLALGLEHLREGGTIVVLLYKVEEPRTLEVLHQFHQFSAVRLFKHAKVHSKRSSFYMVATNVQIEHPEAVRAVEDWKQVWKVATFGDEEAYKELVRRDGSWADRILDSFGSALVQLGEPIWAIQARALESAPFIKDPAATPQSFRQWRRGAK